MTEKTRFNRLIVMARPSRSHVPETLQLLVEFLEGKGINYLIEQQTSQMLNKEASITPAAAQILDLTELTPRAEDLLVVIGGDGSMIYATDQALTYNLPILGINRGKLGFLTDISPHHLEQIAEILDGHYQADHRLMLRAEIFDENGKKLPEGNGSALNDVVLTPGNIAQLISFSISINGEPVCRQRADGLIVATPTGSTAYALSAGGPIVHPEMNAMVLVPMLPHKLSSRPVVISGDCRIDIEIDDNTRYSPSVSCDGGRCIRIQSKYRVSISPHPQKIQLIHPENYNYYDTLRHKLGWERIV